jgi:hypothetical protein
MPRKKKTETAPDSSKTSSKTKAAPKAKAVPKTPRATAKKTGLPKAARDTQAPTAPKPSSAWKKPTRQGETQMVAFIRDPHCIFTYWEVTPQSIESVKQKLMGEYKDSAMVLRVFRTGADGQAELIQEIRVEPGQMNRYVELKEGASGSYFIEIAQKASSGRIVVYARSNKVMTGTSMEQSGAPRGGSQWEAPAGFLEYFSEVEEAVDPLPLRGLSSAEAHRRALLRKQMGMDRYSASRMG